MDLGPLISLANGFAALGVTGLLSLLFILWLTGRLHTSTEKADWEEREVRAEALRLEAIQDRRASDSTVKELAEAMRESNEITRRSIDLNERLVDEFISRRPPYRGPKSHEET
jgi:hypothetical protein